MAKIIGIKFKPVGKIYYFSPLDIEFNVGDGVIVETVRGVEYGKVALAAAEIDDGEIKEHLKPVIRKATDKDENQVKINLEKKEYALKEAKQKIEKHKLNMKLCDCEYTFDNSKVIFYFTAEGRIDFRELVKDLASVFKIRIELRQIGIRDQAKNLGGIAPCGRPCCCSVHLPDFKHVSIKMAKTQCLSLNPSKISGLCGRLMCCLEYENDHYSETLKKMPRVGSEVSTNEGNGTVESNNLLKYLVKVRFEKNDGSFEFKDFPLAEIKATATMAEDIDKDEVPEDVESLQD